MMAREPRIGNAGTHEQAESTVCAGCDVHVRGAAALESGSESVQKGSQAGLDDDRRESEEPQMPRPTPPCFGSCAPRIANGSKNW